MFYKPDLSLQNTQRERGIFMTWSSHRLLHRCIHVQLGTHVVSLVNQTVFRERACASECAFTEYGLVHETTM